MASITKRPNRHYWVQFKAPTGRRQTVRLGKVSREEATEAKLRIERLAGCRAMGNPPDPTTAAWVSGVGDVLRSRLAAAGLVKETEAITLRRMVDDFQASLNVKPSTARNIAFACDSLLAHLGENMLLGSVTEADAKAFRVWITRQGGEKGGPLAPTTVSRRCRRAKQVFQYALDRRWITTSPFAVLRGGSEVNRERDFFVSAELIKAALTETPSASMRAVIVLARFGALRCPSEVLPMEWSQINWDTETMLVRSPKTAHHEDGASRTVPLFPEVREALESLWDEAKEGEPRLFPRRQVTGTALTNELRRACWSAGHALWPKPWQNMRATRETELLQQFPLHVVANWLGHSPNIALKHYAQIAKEHHAQAVKMGESVLRVEAGRSKRRSTESVNGDKVFTSIYTQKPKNTVKV